MNEINEKTFKNADAVIDFLRSDGFRLSRAAFYRHKSLGLISPEPAPRWVPLHDRFYTLRTVRRYSKHFLKRRDSVDLLIELAPTIIDLVGGDAGRLEELKIFLKERGEWLTRAK